MSVVNSILSDELEHYWKLMNASPTVMSRAEFRDELEVLAMFTESEALRRMCEKNLGRFDFFGAPARRVAR